MKLSYGLILRAYSLIKFSSHEKEKKSFKLYVDDVILGTNQYLIIIASE